MENMMKQIAAFSGMAAITKQTAVMANQAPKATEYGAS
jgi:hypothetical protein